jgi:ornithine cyclodeaminase/alanine dehydrogenase-like protein (mu-crystallin family)
MLGRQWEIPRNVAESAEEVPKSADVLITATNAPTPVLTASG